MALRLFLTVTLVSIVGVALERVIVFGTFEHVFNRQPGKCQRHETSGSIEDIALLPNGHALISCNESHDTVNRTGGIYMVDMNAPMEAPKRLQIEGDFMEQQPDFTPHGLGHWIDDTGQVFLYVINHQVLNDIVESFQYHPDKLSLSHRSTFWSPLFYNINDIVLVGLDEFYVTNDHYFVAPWLHIAESLLKLPLGSITYYNGDKNEGLIATGGITYPYGIAQSNNRRFFYVSMFSTGEIVAYQRNNNTLTYVQTLPLQPGLGNVVVDGKGDLWVNVIVKPLHFFPHLKDHTVEIPGKVLHVTVDENASLPFNGSNIEEVFSTTGDLISMSTVAAYHNRKLLIGTVLKDLLYCEVEYLIY